MEHSIKKYQVLLFVEIAEDKVYNIANEIGFVVDTLNDAHQEKMQMRVQSITEVGVG